MADSKQLLLPPCASAKDDHDDDKRQHVSSCFVMTLSANHDARGVCCTTGHKLPTAVLQAIYGTALMQHRHAIGRTGLCAFEKPFCLQQCTGNVRDFKSSSNLIPQQIVIVSRLLTSLRPRLVNNDPA